MKTDRQNSIIELTADETVWFKNPDIEVPVRDLMGTHDHQYRSMRDKVDHIASEIYHETKLTVMIYTENEDNEVALYTETGLELVEPIVFITHR